MRIETLTFDKTASFGRLALDYVAGKPELMGFAPHSFDIDGIKNALAQKRSFSSSQREVLVNALYRQYSEIERTRELEAEIEALRNETTFTVVTAHQPNLFTGPAYFIYKIAGTIALANRLKNEISDAHFVPVYWMGSEDHDLEELNHVHLFHHELRWENGLKGPVGRMPLQTLTPILNQVLELLGDKPEAEELKSILLDCFRPEYTWAFATRKMVNRLFGKFGLVVVDGDDKELKKQFSTIAERELVGRESEALVIKTAERLHEAGYQSQIYPRPINLFWIEDGIRERIIYEAGTFKTVNNQRSWSEKELLHVVHTSPEAFSPNVVLRPVYQELVLPNVAFIGGGAEVAYWMLLKPVFELYEVSMPAVLLRSSAIYVDRSSQTKLDKLGFTIERFFEPVEALIVDHLQEQEKEIFSIDTALTELEAWFIKLANHIETVDPSLKGAALAEGKKVEGQLKALEARVKKAQKQRHETSINQIKLLKAKLFPDQHLQERHDNFMNFYLQEGPAFVELCTQVLDPLSKSFVILKAS